MHSPNISRNPLTAIRHTLAALASHAGYAMTLNIPASNIDRIEAIPFDVLPDMSAARDALISLALHGCDVDAYIPAASGEYVIWCRPASPDMEGRYTIEQWTAVCMREYSRLLPDAWKEALV